MERVADNPHPARLATPRDPSYDVCPDLRLALTLEHEGHPSGFPRDLAPRLHSDRLQPRGNLSVSAARLQEVDGDTVVAWRTRFVRPGRVEIHVSARGVSATHIVNVQ